MKYPRIITAGILLFTFVLLHNAQKDLFTNITSGLESPAMITDYLMATFESGSGQNDKSECPYAKKAATLSKIELKAKVCTLEPLKDKATFYVKL